MSRDRFSVSVSRFVASTSGLVEALQQQMQVETEGDIRSMLASILSSLAIQPHVVPEPIVAALLQHVHPTPPHPTQTIQCNSRPSHQLASN